MSWNADIRTWEAPQRREASLYALAAAVVLMVSAYALKLLLEEESAIWLTVFAVVLLLILVFMVALHLLAPRAPALEAAPDAAPMAGPDSTPYAEPRIVRLKCGNCQTEFDLTDPGTRPLYHTCPGCGAEGVLRGAARPEQAAEDLAAATPAATTAAPEAPAQPIRRLKLRCGGCQTVFVVEDFGQRPIRHSCPGCGKQGELR